MAEIRIDVKSDDLRKFLGDRSQDIHAEQFQCTGPSGDLKPVVAFLEILDMPNQGCEGETRVLCPRCLHFDFDEKSRFMNGRKCYAGDPALHNPYDREQAAACPECLYLKGQKRI